MPYIHPATPGQRSGEPVDTSAVLRIPGKILPIGLPAVLHDIIPNGFAVRTTVSLSPRTTYLFAFSTEPALKVTARVLQSMRIGDPDGTVWYLTGAEFVDSERERDAISSLIHQATHGAGAEVRAASPLLV
jgi:hypothetical protein